jgi:hypothetical protein
MSVKDAYTIYRVMARIHEQIWQAWKDNRDADAGALSELVGRLRYRQFGDVACDAIFEEGRFV